MIGEPSTNIEFVTLAQDEQGGPATAKEEVIESQDGYTSFFDGSPPNSPKVDWSQEVAIAVALGEQTTGGYGVEITEIVHHNIGITGGRTFIRYLIRKPKPEDVVPMIMTYPYHIVKCQRGIGIPMFTSETADQQATDAST
jgi:hypothetical protein